MNRTVIRFSLFAVLAVGPALAQAPAPAMRGMQQGTTPGMQAMPGMKQGMPQNMPMSANHMEMMRQMESMNKAMTDAPMTGNPDQDFVGMMTPHHQGAIDMARTYLRDGRDPEIRRMAQTIIADQEREIRQFKAWQVRHPAAPR